MTICGGQAREHLKVTVQEFKKRAFLAAFADLQGEHKVAADVLLGDDVLHGAKSGAQIGVEKLSGQQAHRGGHQVVWQRHVCDLKIETTSEK